MNIKGGNSGNSEKEFELQSTSVELIFELVAILWIKCNFNHKTTKVDLFCDCIGHNFEGSHEIICSLNAKHSDWDTEIVAKTSIKILANL